jgi:predicted transcriptional regulator
MKTFGELLKAQRDKRKLDVVAFAGLLGVSQPELEKLEDGKATVSNDRAEYWAELLSLSRVETVQLALVARVSGAKLLTEGLANRIHRKV